MGQPPSEPHQPPPVLDRTSRAYRWGPAGCALVLLAIVFAIVWIVSGDPITALIPITVITVVGAVGLAGNRRGINAHAVPATFRLPFWALVIVWILAPAFGLFFWRQWAVGHITGSVADLVSSELWGVGVLSALAAVCSLITMSLSFSVLNDRLRHRGPLHATQIRYEDLTAIEVVDRKSRAGRYLLVFRGRPGSRPIRIWPFDGVYRAADINWALGEVAERAPQVGGQVAAARTALGLEVGTAS